MSINKFAVNSSHIYDITKVSHLSDGLMSSSDKDKLDGLVASENGTNVSVTVVSPSTEELQKEFSDIKIQLLEQRNLYNTIENFINSPGEPDGLATLDASGKLSSDQLPAFKTVNGESVVGEGNIVIRPGTDVDFTPVNTSIDNLSTYINENYAKKNDISVFATIQYVDTAVANVDVTSQLANYALKSDVPAAYDDTQIKSDIADLKKINHDDFALKSDLTNIDLSDYATKFYVSEEIGKVDHSQYLTQHQEIKMINSKSLVGTGNLTLADLSENIVSDSIGTGIQFKNRLIFGSDNIASVHYEDSSAIFIFDKPIQAPNFNSVTTVILTQEEYDTLSTKDENCIYYIRK